ncbi:MAG: nickel pincer cofactor biosynthesis protein LarC [Lentisphaerae bacterium]|nr:nickel pincer cofactor biosynthesis protein LarC [Lentisphaerota bacterium]
MKLLRFDSIGGASGNMILGALIDLGADAELLRNGLSTLPVEPFQICSEPFTDRGFTGTRVSVNIDECPGHPHRGLADIRKLISDSDLPDPVKQRAVSVFERLAGAEAAVHGSSIDKIHFHEVGAVDAIVDIAGACLALHMLGVAEILMGPLPLGRGTVESEHGILPVPAPASVELLKGHQVVQTDEPFELVTPTGAAILTALGSSDVPIAPATVERTGYGFGFHKLTGRANVLRAMLLDCPGEEGRPAHECLVLECNIDDTVPELLGSLVESLLAGGAIDVFTTPVQMKKQRPGTLLTVLCERDLKDSLIDLVFSECTTFGVREYTTTRTVLGRRRKEVTTEYGTIRVKVGSWKGSEITFAPEHDDRVRCAKEKGVPVRAVYEAALERARK